MYLVKRCILLTHCRGHFLKDRVEDNPELQVVVYNHFKAACNNTSEEGDCKRSNGERLQASAVRSLCHEGWSEEKHSLLDHVVHYWKLRNYLSVDDGRSHFYGWQIDNFQ